MTTQLSGTDSLFLSMETSEVHGHIGGLVVLDTNDAPGFSFERVRQNLAERLPAAGAPFLSRLEEDLFGLSRPYWVPDENFDIARHVHRIAVPSPGGMRELAALCGYLHEQKLDRDRPLWEIWLVEGLEDGKVALYMKTHHALMDGMKGNDLSVVLCDLEPEPATAPNVPERKDDRRAPSGIGRSLEGLGNLIGLPGRVASYGLQAIRRGASMLPYVLEQGTGVLPSPSVPRLSFNGELSRHRGFACTSLRLDDVKAVKDAAGVKLNDVAIEICGTAMKKYSERNGESIDGSLAVSCPVSTRTEADRDAANKVASMVVSCASDVDDPVRRLEAIHQSSVHAKEVLTRARRTPIQSIGEVFPPSIVNLGFRALGALAEYAGTVPANAVVSNVPGPPLQLYIAGARVQRVFPISLLATTQGLNFTLVSFLDRLDVGITIDPELVPDPWELAACVDEAFAELRHAVLGPVESKGPEADRSAAKRPSHRKRAGRVVLPEPRSIAAA